MGPPNWGFFPKSQAAFLGNPENPITFPLPFGGRLPPLGFWRRTPGGKGAKGPGPFFLKYPPPLALCPQGSPTGGTPLLPRPRINPPKTPNSLGSPFWPELTVAPWEPRVALGFPFGLRAPLWVQKLLGSFSPGTSLAPLHAGQVRAGCLICYESIFPKIARLQTLAGANLLV